jgi:hypothetical protein
MAFDPPSATAKVCALDSHLDFAELNCAARSDIPLRMISIRNRGLTPLSCALLGLISQVPRSGYALMELFNSTPLRRYSGSAGAVYPALKGLEQLSLIRGEVERAGSLRRGASTSLLPRAARHFGGGSVKRSRLKTWRFGMRS